MPKKQGPKKQSFIATVLSKLSELDVTCRPMFGCYGLYRGDIFFAIVCGDDLFFPTDEQTKVKYIKKGMPALQFRENQKSDNYYCVPESVIRSPKKLQEWALEAVETQRVKKASKGLSKKRASLPSKMDL